MGRHRPAAVLCNEIISMFNELRQCSLTGIRVLVLRALRDRLLARGIAATLKKFQTDECHVISGCPDEFGLLCRNIRTILVQLINAHLKVIYGSEGGQESIPTDEVERIFAELPG